VWTELPTLRHAIEYLAKTVPKTLGIRASPNRDTQRSSILGTHLQRRWCAVPALQRRYRRGAAGSPLWGPGCVKT
jgi:hypothetical protein